jgi:hypothetical protein
VERGGSRLGGERKATIGEERSTGHGRKAARVSLRGGLFIPRRWKKIERSEFAESTIWRPVNSNLPGSEL